MFLPVCFSVLLFYIDDWSDATISQVASLLRTGLDPGTLGGYRLGLSLWNEFRHHSLPDTQPRLPLRDIYLLGANRSLITLKVVEFLTWMTSHKGILPHIAVNHLVAVRHGFTIHLGDGGAFDKGTALSLARSAYRAKSSREELLNSAVTEIQPLIIEQLDWMRQHFWIRAQASIDERMAYIAIALSQNVILRIGEVVSEGPYLNRYGDVIKTDHRFYYGDLLLEDDMGQPHQVDTYFLSPAPRPTIIYFRLEVLSTKTSHRRAVKLRPYHFFRHGNTREIQFFDDFLHFIELSEVRDLTKPLFSRRDPIKNTYAEAQGRTFREALKAMAAHFHLDPSLYSGKSTRKGGATSMRMSDRPDSDMLTLTGHAHLSTTVGHYITDVGHRLGGNTFRNTDEGQVSLAQLKRSLPSAYRVPHAAPGTSSAIALSSTQAFKVCVSPFLSLYSSLYLCRVLLEHNFFVDRCWELLRYVAPQVCVGGRRHYPPGAIRVV